jgi:hypothetical protein
MHLYSNFNEFNLMKNQYTLTSRELSILLVFTLLSVSLIPAVFIWGKSSKANGRGKKEEKINFDLFLDEGCTIMVESIDWGEITSGSSSTVVVYIKNLGKIPVTLSCYLSDFSPDDAADYLALDWDREGYLLEARKTVRACLTLSVSELAQFNSFTVDVLISGTA